MANEKPKEPQSGLKKDPPQEPIQGQVEIGTDGSPIDTPMPNKVPSIEVQQIAAATPFGCGYFTKGNDVGSPDYIAGFCEMRFANQDEKTNTWEIDISGNKMVDFVCRYDSTKPELYM